MSDSTPPRRPLWKRVITAISLSLNVLILGALAGLLLSGSGGEGDRPPPLRNNGGIAPLIGMLPPEQRTVVLEDLRRIGKEHGVTHRQLAEDRDRVVQVITAEPFDPLRLVAVLAENQTRFASYGEGGA